MRVLVGALIAGVILYIVPGTRSGPACVLAGALAAWLLAVAGPRSIVEKVGMLMAASMIAWLAGPRAARGESLLLHLGGWLAASSALAFYLHPRRE